MECCGCICGVCRYGHSEGVEMEDPPLWLRRSIMAIERELSAKLREEMRQDLRVEMDMTPIPTRGDPDGNDESSNSGTDHDR